MEIFLQYYGLDWLSSLVGLLGMYLVSEKKPIGFIFSAVSIAVAAVVAIWAAQYGFLVANTAGFIIAVRGYIKWSKEPKQE